MMLQPADGAETGHVIIQNQAHLAQRTVKFM